MVKIILVYSLILFSLDANASPRKKCWCHGLVAVSGTEYNCQQYRCPCEGANGPCPTVAPSGKTIKKTIKIAPVDAN
jgi:hypothetical protein